MIMDITLAKLLEDAVEISSWPPGQGKASHTFVSHRNTKVFRAAMLEGKDRVLTLKTIWKF